MTHSTDRKVPPLRPLARLVWVSFRDLAVAAGPLLLATVIAIGAAYWLVRPAPPETVTLSAGPNGSIFRLVAEKYAKILARSGVTLRVLPSEGSLDNLKRLIDPTQRVDVGFVQGGVSRGGPVEGLVSLGSMFHEPLALFYRRGRAANRVSDLRGKRIAIGREGSGAHALALTLLKANGIEPGGKTVLVALDGQEAAKALISGKVAAAFLMGDSATPPTMRALMRTPGIRLFTFAQADAYVRRFPYLNRFDLPMGAFDLGRNLPPRDIHLIGPTVELVAREHLHPALSDLLIEAAREVHGGSGLLQRAGEFPAPREHEYRLSDDAKRYYTSGKRIFYRYLPFWLATLTDRLLVAALPIVVLLIPGLKLVPTLYRWRIRSRIYRWYGILISLERKMLAEPSPEERRGMLRRLDDIEVEVNKMRMPLAFADQFYVLRDHIRFVRERYTTAAEAA
ncbi:MAG: ABC transporter substrate-binding protein [candidate division NC10 bacterium]|nr:ABC transporter substrate-binding protein [candidate division NC10 bacterium]